MNEKDIEFEWYRMRGKLEERTKRKRIWFVIFIWASLILSNSLTFYLTAKNNLDSFTFLLFVLLIFFGILFEQNLKEYIFQERGCVLFQFPDAQWGWEFMRYGNEPIKYKGEFEGTVPGGHLKTGHLWPGQNRPEAGQFFS